MARIGSSDLDVFPLNLGGNPFGWTADAPTSEAIMDAFLAGGGNFIDTADAYMAKIPGNVGGESETIMGNWMTARGNRESVIVATKVGKFAPLDNLKATTIQTACDNSLERLQTDYIDLYYTHADDPTTPIEETAAALDSLVREGKVRYIGLSNYGADRVREYLSVCEEYGYAKPVALQPHYNLLHRNEFEGDLQEVAVEQKLAVMPFWSLAAGFLTGKYRTLGDATGSRPGMVKHYVNETGLAALPVLDEIAAAHRVNVGVVAIAWLRYQPSIVAPIASASTPEQVPDLLAAGRLELAADEVAALNALETINHVPH